MSATAARLLGEVEALRRSEPARALALLEAQFAAAARGAEAAVRGALWRTRGHVLRSLRRTREAVIAYRRAERAYAEAGDAREQGRCAIGLVDALMYLGRTTEAQRAAVRGRRLLERAGDRAALARLLNNEGNLWHRLDLPERALACYRQAMRALQREGDDASARMIGVNVGNCLSLLGRCDEAREHYRGARTAQEAAANANEALSAEYNLAYLDFLELRHEAALSGLAAVRERAESRGYPSLAALAALDRAEIFLRLGAHDDSRDEAKLAIERCTALGLRYESAKAELFGALARFRSGETSAAIGGIERALEAFDAEGNEVWTGEGLVGLATVWWRQGNPRAAAVLLAAARRRFRAAGDRERLACALTLEARARLAAGDSRGAAACLRAVAAHGRRSARRRHLELAAHAALARVRGDVARARRLLQRAARESERLAARILDEEWRATFWGEWGWPHRELAMLELDEGRLEAALEALEAGRGRALIGEAVTRGGRGGALPASVRRWAAARQARARARRGAELPDAPADAQAPGVHRQLAQRTPGVMRAASVRRALGADTRLLDYFEHDGSLGAFVLESRGLAARRALLSDARLQHLAHALLFSLRSAAFAPATARAADSPLREALGELASLAVWPLLAGAPRRLAVSPVGALARVPWAALPRPDGRALCEAHELVIAPGLRLAMTRSGAPATGAPLVVAADAGELAAVHAETEALVRAFPGARVLAGADATADRFAALAPEASWIHFAGHGGWRADEPHASGLRLADRWLLAGEIAALPLGARFVTLSACHTARALVRPGEEWFGLARAFLLAGAGSVVAAQWDVEDEVTASLMGSLYAELREGRALPAALAAAQAERAVAGRHPYEWAGFVVLGGPGTWGDERPSGNAHDRGSDRAKRHGPRSVARNRARPGRGN